MSPLLPLLAATLPAIIAHRGASAERPENTLAAYERAIDSGADVIEADPRLTADNQLVSLHDPRLEWTTSGSGPVSAITLAQLSLLDAGSKFKPEFRGERVPTLTEILALARGRVRVLLDLKLDGQPYLDLLAAEIRRKHDESNVLAGVRSLEQVAYFQKNLPTVELIGLVPTLAAVPAFLSQGVPSIRIWPHWESSPPPNARLLLTAETGSADEWRRIAHLRPVYVFTNHPARLAATLRKNGVSRDLAFDERREGSRFPDRDWPANFRLACNPAQTATGVIDGANGGAGIQQPALTFGLANATLHKLQLGSERLILTSDFKLTPGGALTVKYAWPLAPTNWRRFSGPTPAARHSHSATEQTSAVRGMGVLAATHSICICGTLSTSEQMTTFCESPCLLANTPTICRGQRCLIRYSARGDRGATELLFERVYAAVYQQARRISRGGDDAEDLAQDTLILAFEGLAYLQDPQRLLHWMSKIAWNRHRERLRLGKFAPPSFDEYVDNRCSCFVCKPDHPVDRLILRETAESLSRGVRALPPTLYDAFRLRVLDQLSTRETAARLSTTEMAVRTRLRRARQMLRKSLHRETESRS